VSTRFESGFTGSRRNVIPMPTVLFEANLFGAECQVEAPGGGPLVDVCDAARAPVPFSCRDATCGTCLIEILQGSELFEPPSTGEAELLAALAYPPRLRLACQAELTREKGLIRLRIADDEP
jgi:adenylate cyclase